MRFLSWLFRKRRKKRYLDDTEGNSGCSREELDRASELAKHISGLGEQDEAEPTDPQERIKYHQAIADRAMDFMAGVWGHATLSDDGYPVCPKCGKKFPLSVDRIREQMPEGVRVFICSKCGKLIRVMV